VKPKGSPFSQRGLLLLAIAGILCLTLVLQIPSSPRYEEMGPDSGLFAYAGQQILHGALLYRDLFDTKTPGVFYLNALTMSVLGETPVAVWWLGVVYIAVTASVLLLVLRRASGLLPASLACIAFLLTLHHPSYYQGGNFTEVYALLPQVLTLATLLAYFGSGRGQWVVVAGFFTALSMLFKPTCVGLGLAGISVVLWQDLRRRVWKRALYHAGEFAVGIAIPLALVGAYFGIRGAFPELWDAVVAYDITYSAHGFSLRSLYTTVRILFIEPPLAVVSVVSVASAAVYVRKVIPSGRQSSPEQSLNVPVNATPSVQRAFEQRRWFYGSVFCAVFLEWALTSVSGRNFGHYFMTPLPAMAACLAFLLDEVRTLAPEIAAGRIGATLSVSLLAVLGTAWSLEVLVKDLPSREELIQFVRNPFDDTYLVDPVARYVEGHTDPSQSVLVWSTHPSTNFLSRRRAPSRYLFATQLLLPGSGSRARFVELMQDLQDDPPVLIVTQTQSSAGVPYLGAPESEICPTCTPEVLEGLIVLRNYVEQHYAEADRIGEWVIYRRVN